MSVQAHAAGRLSEPTPEVVAQLRVDAEVAAVARDLLRSTSPDVLREAIRLRAARIQVARDVIR